MKTNLVFAALPLLLLANPAYAQSTSNFDGPSVSIFAGYDSVDLEIDELDTDGSDDGFLYGITAGYDFDLGNVVAGFEAEYSDSAVKETAVDVLETGDELTLLAGRDLYIGARVGAKLSPNWLLYAKGGYTNAQVKGRYDDGTDVLRGSDEVDGFRIGAGAEYATQTFFGRLEYRYSDYGNYSFEDVDTGLGASRHQVVASVGARF